MTNFEKRCLKFGVEDFETWLVNASIEGAYACMGECLGHAWSSGSYHNSVRSLYRKGDFLFDVEYFLDRLTLVEMYVVLNGGRDISVQLNHGTEDYGPSISVYSTSTTEVKKVLQTHSNGFIIDGPWWKEFRQQIIPQIKKDYEEFLLQKLQEENKMDKKKLLEKIRQEMLWESRKK